MDNYFIKIDSDYEFHLSSGDFNELLGFDKGILSDQDKIWSHVPDISRSVDWVYFYCKLISRSVDNVGSDVLFALSTVNIQVSYPFKKEPKRLKWHPIYNKDIHSIRIYVTWWEE